MAIELETLRDDLRALMNAPPIRLPEYSADPIVQRRVGRLLGETSTYLTAGPALPHAEAYPTKEQITFRLGGTGVLAPE